MTGAPRAGRRPRLRAPAECALIAVTLAALVALRPLFDTWTYLPRLVVVALAAHLTVVGARSLRLRLPLTGLLTAAGFLLTTAWLFLASTTWYGLPTAASWQAAGHDLADGWSRFQTVVAPAQPTTGFLLATTVAVWLAAFVADWAAFRLWTPFEAIVPTAGLVLFAAVLGADEHSIGGAVAYLAVALAFFLLHRAYRQERAARWVGSGTGRGTRALLASGFVLVVAALAIGLLAAPRLPGADAPGLIALDGRGGADGPRVTLSPLVDIRARLLDQRHVEVFTVDAAAPAYWRLTSLDRFDGDIWSSGGTFEEAQGALPNGVAPDRPSQQVEQSYHIEALSTIWLPAAYEAASVDSGSLDVRWEPASSTLIVDQQRATSDGTSYRVVSLVPRLSPELLRGVPAPPTDLLAHYTALPDGFSPDARALAGDVTASAATDYDRALALQNFFRSGFSYRTDVPAGHGEDAIDAFLARRAGFCEQFAGTFAAMARSIGLPARVAVGFTPGEQDPADPTRYHVRGEHAHAWPEVYFTGFGWVAFEPTPGRGAPGAESYTGVQPQQAESAGTATTADTTTATVTPATTTAPRPATTTVTAPSPRPRDDGSAPSWPGRLALLSFGVLAVGAGYVLVVVVGLALRRTRWRWRARRGPNERTRVAWLEATDALATAGLVPEPSETPVEFSVRASERLDTGRDAHRALARAATAVDYAAGGVSSETAEQAAHDARTVITGVRRRVRWARRAAWRLGWRSGRADRVDAPG